MSTGASSLAWRRIPQARSLAAWSRPQLLAVARVLQEARAAWRAGWGLAAESGDVVCLPAGADPVPDGGWQAAGASEAAAAWIALPVCFADEVAEGLWGREGWAGPIAARITRACVADLLARLRAALRLDAPASGPVDPPQCGSWSGVVDVALGSGLRLLLDAGAVEKVLRSAAPDLCRQAAAPGSGDPLAPLAAALAGIRVAVRAALADGELSLASLQDLRVGDVVPLPHRLDAPLLVRDARAEVLFAGFLARQGPHMALELAPLPPAGGTTH